VNLSLKTKCLLKEENTPIAMNTHLFAQIVTFIGVLSCCYWYTIVLQDVVHNQRDTSIERREHAHCNEHKFVCPDCHFHWCLELLLLVTRCGTQSKGSIAEYYLGSLSCVPGSKQALSPGALHPVDKLPYIILFSIH
jgi:hypothetical protein